MGSPPPPTSLNSIGSASPPRSGWRSTPGGLDLGVAFAAPLQSDREDGLWPTVVVDEQGVALGLAYSDTDSLSQAFSTRAGVYHSRKRGLWTKGKSSGATQELIAVDVDCDRDTLRFTVRQNEPGFCHAPARTCWGEDRGLPRLLRRLKERNAEAPAGSYTARLLQDRALLEEKLLEEARELAEARTPAEVAHEAADVLYFTGVALARGGVDPQRRGARTRPKSATRQATLCLGTARSAMKPFLWPRLGPRDVSAARPSAPSEEIQARANAILEEVKRDGTPCPRALDRATGWCEPLRLVDPRPCLARSRGEGDLRGSTRSFEAHADRIETFARLQLGSVTERTLPLPGGGCCRQELVPMERAGCYAPGGRYPLVSSVLMTGVTARVAGVEQITLASPNPSPLMLAAAQIAGATSFLAAGGAQAIGALAYGVEGLAPVDMLVGPGNAYVTAAKQKVSSEVGIDLPAGPSELVILADAEADARLVAADLIAQAEHDVHARAFLVTPSAPLLEDVERELERQLETLPGREVAKEALASSGSVQVANLAEGCTVCNELAPEHLELQVADSASLLPALRHYGALFVGSAAAEVFGDYGIGPNHVLPTGGGARRSGGLSVFDFLRIRTVLDCEEVAPQVVEDTIALARLEGLEGHARAAESRRL